MKDLLAKPIATIEFQFLQELSCIDAWNNTLFELFKWIDEKENILKKGHILFLHDQQIFYKISGENVIGIYHNKDFVKPARGQKLLIGLVRNGIETASISYISQLLSVFLDTRKIKNRDISMNSNMCHRFGKIQFIKEIII